MSTKIINLWQKADKAHADGIRAYIAFGQALAELNAAGVTQEEIAERYEMSQQSVSNAICIGTDLRFTSAASNLPKSPYTLYLLTTLDDKGFAELCKPETVREDVLIYKRRLTAPAPTPALAQPAPVAPAPANTAALAAAAEREKALNALLEKERLAAAELARRAEESEDQVEALKEELKEALNKPAKVTPPVRDIESAKKIKELEKALASKDAHFDKVVGTLIAERDNFKRRLNEQPTAPAVFKGSPVEWLCTYIRKASKEKLVAMLEAARRLEHPDRGGSNDYTTQLNAMIGELK